MFLLTNLCYDLVDESNDRLIHIMCFINSFQNSCFRNFVCTGFDHDNLLCCRSNSHLQITFIPLLLAWIDDQFAVDHTNLCHGTRTVKRNI